jgi:hypothetical protein
MIQKRGTSSVAALVLARTMQRSAITRDDPDMLADAKDYEERALAAIKAGQNELPPREAKKVVTEKRGYSSEAALAMAQAQKRLAEDTGDADLALYAIRLERRALEAIALHLTVLPELDAPAK